MRLAFVVLVGCGAASPPPPAPPPKVVVAQPLARITLEAGGAASRGQGSPRALRRLLATRHGEVELAANYAEVSLQVTRVIAGSLDDPDYARRPTGVNALTVILTDDAAFAAPADMDGFAGTWT